VVGLVGMMRQRAMSRLREEQKAMSRLREEQKALRRSRIPRREYRGRGGA
jgi:hypothetical protein